MSGVNLYSGAAGGALRAVAAEVLPPQDHPRAQAGTGSPVYTCAARDMQCQVCQHQVSVHAIGNY